MARPYVGRIVAVRIPDPTLASIEQLATEAGRDRSDIIRMLLEDALKYEWGVA